MRGKGPASLPSPAPGQVIGYAYLWREEHRRGIEEGRKDRPSAIIATLVTAEGKTDVLVLPITHTPPVRDGGVELPAAVKRRLGLDDLPSWVITTEANSFRWPGPDLRQMSNTGYGPFLFGYLPTDLFRKIIAQYRANAAKPIHRTD